MAGFRKKRKWSEAVETYEVFVDSQNLPQFNSQQMEGKIEKPISKRSLMFLGLGCLAIGLVIAGRVGLLQIRHGQAYFNMSQNNTLEKQIIFAQRGIVNDRNKVPLIWNTEAKTAGDFSERAYIKSPGFGHILGFVSYPAKDQSGNYWQENFIGKDGIEKQYNTRLSGENGFKLTETDVKGKIQSENVLQPPKDGDTLTLTVDSRIQSNLYQYIKQFSENNFFQGGTGVLMDVKTGEIIALTNFPEYSPEIMSSRSDQYAIRGYLADKRKPFLDRAVSGLYTPGSIVKPIVALGALNEGVIDPLKKILSTGSISIPNPYYPGKESVFKDWRPQGWIDMRSAIAVSSDVYFYEVGGGFQDQKGLGISNIEKYYKLFGFSSETGIDLPAENSGTIPTPLWKQVHFPNDPWRVGDTYNTAIGQYGVQVTALEMVRAAAAIANYGTLPTPHILMEDLSQEKSQKTDIPKEYFDVVHEGMRGSAVSGTASRLNVDFVKVAAKTGTAQVGAANNRVNSWVIGFFPYDNPRYAFTVMMENGPISNAISVSYIMNQLLQWMNQNAPEYLSAGGQA
jgi:penicillin-binding protein 2